MSIELCLFRHGRTTWNASRRWQGHADIDLDALGRAQALAVADRVMGMDPQALYSSDLRRCHDVAAAISDSTGVPIQLDQRLRERDVGEWSGLTREEVAERFPQQWKKWNDFEDVRSGGAESSAEMWARVAAFLDHVRVTHDDGLVVAVTHGVWILNAVMQVITGRLERIGIGVCAQASLTVLTSANGGPFELEAFNDRGHLIDVEPIDQEGPASPIH